MAEIHVASSTPLTQELTTDVRAEMSHWRDLYLPTLSGELLIPEEKISHAINCVMEEMLEHVQIRFATTLATFGIGES